VIGAGFALRAYLDSWQTDVTQAPRPPAARTTGLLPFDVALPDPARVWQLGPGLAGWKPEPGTVTRPTSPLSVTTSPTSGYQLVSPSVTLTPGRYVAAVRGDIRSAGMAVGVLDVPANRFLGQASYLASSPPRPATMPAYFTLTVPTRVQVILSNALPHRSARWGVDEVVIAPQTPAVRPHTGSLAAPVLPSAAAVTRTTTRTTRTTTTTTTTRRR
jgi:hypothetical protein